MKNLTTPQAVLGGLALIALAIASIPYSSNIVTPAHAAGGVQKVAICSQDGKRCARVTNTRKDLKNISMNDLMSGKVKSPPYSSHPALEVMAPATPRYQPLQ